MKNITKNIAAPIDILRLIVKHEPKYFLFYIPQMVLLSILPFLHIFMPKRIIELLTAKSPFLDILAVICVYCLAVLLINLLNNTFAAKCSVYGTDFDRRLRIELGQTFMSLPISNIEGAAMQDTIRLAQNSSDLVTVADILNQMLQSVITIIGVAFIVVKLDIRLFAAIALILGCKIVFTRLQYGYRKKMRILSTQNDRAGDYLFQMCYFHQGGAKEIRVNNLQNWFLSKVKKYRSRMVNLQLKDFRRNAVFDGFNAVLMGGFSFVVLIMLSFRYLDNGLSIADFTMYFTAITTLLTALLSFADLVGKYNQQLLKVADYKKLINTLKEQQTDSTVSDRMEISEVRKIRFEGVSFKYPNTDHDVLKDVNITISANEKLIIVGLNGAGKSTFIKLLCKFYRPTKGTIRLNGTDIWSIPNAEYLRLLSAVFQDFSIFAFTVSEDIALKEGFTDINNALNAVKLTEQIDKLPRGAETYLSKEFSSDGIDLSGGQKQKIAIARALYKNTPILILDEPTASLDPKAESEIYTDLFHIAENKTTVFISHRLAASSIADHIAVFAGGKIIEYGTHLELIQQGGVYADMYRKQSSAYVG